MSIDIYRELNKELVEKVQELKKANAFLEKEIISLNARYFEENQLRMEERQTMKSIISRLKADIDDAQLFLNVDDTTSRSTTSDRSSGSRRTTRTRSCGVTTRSPGRPSSSELVIEAQGDRSPELPTNSETFTTETPGDKSCASATPWGFEVIEEKSSRSDNDENTVIPLSQLSITNETIQAARKDDSRRKTFFLSPLPVIQLTSSYENSEINQESIETIRSSASSIEDETFKDPRNVLTTSSNLGSLSNSTIDDFKNTVHSTPIHVPSPKETTIEKLTEKLSETSIANTNNSTTARPRRTNSSISYTEPSLNKKLRNEKEIKRKPKKGRANKNSN